MKLIAPTQSIDFMARDVHGEEFSLSDYRGRAVVLSFFRNASCPFCLKRVFDLAVRQRRWRSVGVEVVAVFTSPSKEMSNFHKNKFDRYRVVPDPTLEIYKLYGIEKSFPGFVRGIAFRLPTVISGFIKGGQVDKNNPNGLILPADFLIGPDGNIEDLWYGSNAAENMPMKRIQAFVRRIATRRLNESTAANEAPGS